MTAAEDRDLARAVAPEADDKVLSTLNRDGSRRWIDPKLSRGRFLKRRRVVAWSLIAVFNLIPILRMNGKPLILLDVPSREFTFFGRTFLPTDSFLLMLLLFSIFVGIFLLTAALGRVWCGWGCPQTVYMEHLYRPLERWIENVGLRRGRAGVETPGVRKAAKTGIFLIISAFLANTFLAYFVGWDSLLTWMSRSPADHPGPFAIMAAVTALMFLDFSWFREQTCIVACPYGRFQSVLLDRHSLIVGYDKNRGEPRGRLTRDEERKNGDCIDCRMCVATCPTGIDIRDGLQMECIHCTQCIDACDGVMDRIGLPRGLVRYSSQAELETGVKKLARPRLLLYSTILLVMMGALTTSLVGKSSADITLLRGLGAPFTILPSGSVSNQIRIKIANRTRETRTYGFELLAGEGIELVAPENPLEVDAGETGMTAAFLTAPPDVFVEGELAIRIRFFDGEDVDIEKQYRLLGPESSQGGS